MLVKNDWHSNGSDYKHVFFFLYFYCTFQQTGIYLGTFSPHWLQDFSHTSWLWECCKSNTVCTNGSFDSSWTKTLTPYCQFLFSFMTVQGQRSNTVTDNISNECVCVCVSGRVSQRPLVLLLTHSHGLKSTVTWLVTPVFPGSCFLWHVTNYFYDSIKKNTTN